MRKDDQNFYVFQYINWYSRKSDQFFSNFIIRRPFHRKHFKRKKTLRYWINFKKNMKPGKQN